MANNGDEEHFQTFEYFNRDFHRIAVESNAYLAPVDEYECERLHIQHEALLVLFDNKLIFPRIHSLRRVLDCGCGPSSWSWAVAEEHARCEVVGIDVCPYPTWWSPSIPGNLRFELFDLNNGLTSIQPNNFDLVNSRLVVGGIDAGRWNAYLRDIRRVLRAGGWCQMVEIYFNAQSDNATLTDDHALRRWSAGYLEAMGQNKNPRAPGQLAAMMRAAGFREVEELMFPLPLCGWTNGTHERMYDIGVANQENVRRLLDSLALYPFTRQLGMDHTEFQLLVAQARHEAANPAFKPYFPLYVCVGRKPRH